MRNQVISQQQLWRPAEEVLHFLTECRPEQSSPTPSYKEASIAPTPSTEVPKASNVKRQAPAVWRPPVAMKPQIPGPPLALKEEPNKPDSTSSSFLDDKDNDSVREIITGARDWHNFFGGEANAHLVNSDLGGIAGTQLMPPPRAPTEDHHNAGAHQVLESNKLFPRQDLQLSVFPNPFIIENSSVEFSSSHFQGNANATVATSSIVQDKGADLLVKQRIGIVSPFMKQQVAQTPLFSGLGTVSFGSGSFSQPPPSSSSSIFAQSPGFGSQGEQQQAANLRRSSSTTTSALSFGSGSFSVQPPASSSIFAAFGGQRVSSSTAGEQQQQQQQEQAVNLRLSSTTSASERGSCDSPAGNPATDVGGVRPKELPRKSLVSNPGGGNDMGPVQNKLPANATDAAAATTRKLRTRPLDLLMNAIKVAAPKLNSIPAQAADSQGKKESAAPAATPPAAKQQQQQARAYFMHTGAWIVQKKSTRHAKNAFKRSVNEVNASGGGGAKGSSKKRSLTAISQEKKTSDKQGKKKQPVIHEVPKKKKKKKIEKPVIEKQVVVVSHAPKKKMNLIEKQEEKKKMIIHNNTTTKNNNTPVEAELVLPVDNDPPLIRSKRGRSQALPSRLRDSVINKVKKKTRKG